MYAFLVQRETVRVLSNFYILLTMLKINIKASHITNLTDARYFAAKDVEWLSFNFIEKDESYIDPMVARAMFEWVAVPTIVGEFDHILAEEINFYAQNWGLKAVQVGPFTPLSIVKDIKGIPIIKEFQVEKLTAFDILRADLAAFSPYIQAFQLNFDTHGISWEDLKKPSTPLSIENLKNLCADFNIILSLDFEPFRLDEIAELKLYGLNVKGSAEERIGVKSFDALDDIFDALEVFN
jgi:phosphoribosylanthranilate isomerase